MNEYNVISFGKPGRYIVECRDCHRKIRIRKDGRIPRHDPPSNWSPNRWKTRPCCNSEKIAIRRKMIDE